MVLMTSLIVFVIGIIFQEDLVLKLAGVCFSVSSLMLFNNILTAYKMEIPEAPPLDPQMEQFMKLMKKGQDKT